MGEYCCVGDTASSMHDCIPFLSYVVASLS